MVSDNKKVQTMVNIVGRQAQIIRDAIQTMKDVRTVFNIEDPVVTGTPLQGNKVAVSAAIDDLDTEASVAALTAMINGIVPSHKEGAI